MEESHYKRMLKRILEVFDEYKAGKCQSTSVISVTSSNIGALDALSKGFEVKTDIFIDNIREIKEENILRIEKKYTPDTEKERKRILKYIEEYEPYMSYLKLIGRIVNNQKVKNNYD